MWTTIWRWRSWWLWSSWGHHILISSSYELLKIPSPGIWCKTDVSNILRKREISADSWRLWKVIIPSIKYLLQFWPSWKHWNELGLQIVERSSISDRWNPRNWRIKILGGTYNLCNTHLQQRWLLHRNVQHSAWIWKYDYLTNLPTHRGYPWGVGCDMP